MISHKIKFDAGEWILWIQENKNGKIDTRWWYPNASGGLTPTKKGILLSPYDYLKFAKLVENVSAAIERREDDRLTAVTEFLDQNPDLKEKVEGLLALNLDKGQEQQILNKIIVQRVSGE